jgi:hypothetical protein
MLYVSRLFPELGSSEEEVSWQSEKDGAECSN